jgi:O-antigen/teichoic acid export membrane protein
MWALIALKKRSQLLIIYFISMIVNITSNYICIPLYGYLASAWITVVSESLVFILSLLVIQKHFQQKKY